MDRLGKRDLKKIIEYIFDNFSGKKIKLVDYLTQMLPTFVLLLDEKYKEDDLLICLCDEIGYQRFVFDLNEHLLRTEAVQGNTKVSLSSQFGIEFIESTPFGEQVHSGGRKTLLGILKKFEQLDDHEKGRMFEQFCSLFLKDMGMSVETTSYSNDAGIDIVGKIPVSYKNNLLERFLRSDHLYFSGQAKFYTSRVDTPVIRHLIADSIYYRFQSSNVFLAEDTVVLNNHPTVLCVFSNVGFTENAKMFADEHGVLLIDSKRMIDLICSVERYEQLSSVVYLLGFEKNLKLSGTNS